MGLRVLITNVTLMTRSGTELYTRDLALELARQGHEPAVLTSATGAIADELRQAGIPVTTSLRSLPFKPDVIHGHHGETLTAVLSFPTVPAIFVCHSHTSWHEDPPIHPRIRRYLGVSEICVARLRESGIPEERIQLSLNFVDTARFAPRSPLPQNPRKALVFSNYANSRTHLPVIAEACREAGLVLDVVGQGVGNSVARPEDLLAEYDIIFAKAKAAMEAIAVGAMVVLCDFSGVGPMVTSAEFDRLRQQNFGFAALRDPLEPGYVTRQIARYDPVEAARVQGLLRASAGLDGAVSRLVDMYQQVIDEQAATTMPIDRFESQRYYPFRLKHTLRRTSADLWQRLPKRYRDAAKSSPVLGGAKRVCKRLIFGLR